MQLAISLDYFYSYINFTNMGKKVHKLRTCFIFFIIFALELLTLYIKIILKLILEEKASEYIKLQYPAYVVLYLVTAVMYFYWSCYMVEFYTRKGRGSSFLNE